MERHRDRRPHHGLTRFERDLGHGPVGVAGRFVVEIRVGQDIANVDALKAIAEGLKLKELETLGK